MGDVRCGTGALVTWGYAIGTNIICTYDQWGTIKTFFPRTHMKGRNLVAETYRTPQVGTEGVSSRSCLERRTVLGVNLNRSCSRSFVLERVGQAG